LRLVFVAVGLLIVVLVLASVLIARDLHDSAQSSYLRSVIPLRTAALDLELELVNEETGVRGYVITDTADSLAPYLTGRLKARADMRLLEARAARDPRLAPLVTPVVHLRSQLNVFFAGEITLVRSGLPREQRRARSEVQGGKSIFDAFRAAIATIQTFAVAQTSQAKQHQDQLFWRLVAIASAAGSAAVAVMALLAWRVPKRAFLLLEAQQRASSQADRLREDAETVQALTADLSSAVTVDDVHAALARTAIEMLEADALSVGLHNPESSTIDVWTHGLPHALDAEPSPAELAATRDGRPHFIEDDSSGGPFQAIAALPLLTTGALPRGYLGVHYRSPQRFPATQRRRLHVIAAQVENALARAESHDRERRTAESLQHALLPAALPNPTRGQLVGYYRAGSKGTLVGGDWYDAVALDDGRIAGSVGDVAGHGIAAAAQMGRLRHSYRAYALENRSPAEILARLTRHLNPDAMATAICFDLNPETRQLRYCSSGHPPPILLELTSHKITMLDQPGAPPLGIAEPHEFADTTLGLGPRSLLFAYTDGLVERRKQSLTERIEKLANLVASIPIGNLNTYVTEVITAITDGEDTTDDIAALAIAL
jgi:CHASE3 domain sensor protein